MTGVRLVVLASLLSVQFLRVADTSKDPQLEKLFAWKVVNSQYVDKSLLIKEIIQDTHKVIIINRPFGSGKSVNLDMMFTFFARSKSRALFVGGNYTSTFYDEKKSVILEPLKIAQFDDIMKHQGNYPVLDIKLDAVQSELDVWKMILTQVAEHFEYEHSYLKDWMTSNNSLTERFEKYKKYDAEGVNDHVTREDVVDSLRFVSEALYKYHGKKVYILVERYDWPFMMKTYLINGPEMLQEVMLLFRDIYCRAFNNNSYVEKGVLTGVLRLADVYDEVFSHVQNVLEDTIVHERFPEFHQFSKLEVENWVSKSNRKLLDGELSLERWCCENRHNDYTCHPAAVRDYLCTQDFVRPSGHNESIHGQYFLDERLAAHSFVELTYPRVTFCLARSEKTQHNFRRFYMGESVLFPVMTLASYNIHFEESSVPSLLMHYGYLSRVAVPETDGMLLKVTNEDSKLWFHLQMQEWIREKFVCANYLRDSLHVLLTGQLHKFREIWLWVNCHFKVALTKALFNGLMIVLWDPINILKMNDDELRHVTYFGMQNDTVIVVLFPQRNAEVNDVAIVAAYRFADDEQSMEAVAIRCAKEIDVDVFSEQMKRYQYVKKIKKIGFAFCKHNVSVKSVEEGISGRGR